MDKLCRQCGPRSDDDFYPGRSLCKDCQNSARTERARANPDQQRAARRRQRLKRYGLTPEDYDALAEAQGNACAICLEPGDLDAASQHRLGVDHDHVTGRVRGLLCRPCNRAVGILADDPVRADRLAAYLRA